MRNFINSAVLPTGMRFGFVLVALVVFLAGCITIQEAPPAASPVPQPVAPEPSVEQPPVPAEQAPVETQANETANATNAPEEGVFERPTEDAPTVTKFLALFRSEVKNYRFIYKSDTWYVAGTKAKVEPYRVLQNQYNVPFIDTIYFDLERRTAIGVCEGRDSQIKKQCLQRQTLGKPYGLPFVQLMIKLPEDWLTEFQNLYLAPADTPKLAADRPTVHLKHITKTRVTDLYIDPSSGLPVAVIDAGTEYQYDKLAKNQLGPNDRMVPP